ncbi:MAG: enoyl-CoA hydratase/isomerase family protein [Acidobacteria bacterium]|nr:enoyl-CoA hydratase/isomerase family protein [Acidobacteriota bacterium]
MSSRIRFEKEDDRYRIILADPPLHILDTALLIELREAVDRVEPDRPLLLIEAEGSKAFSAGASVQDHLGDRVGPMLEAFHGALRALHRLDLVSVAKVRGLCLGGGCELAMACDFILASDCASFGQPEIALGVFPPVAVWQLGRLASPRKGLEMVLTGDPIPASEAARLGMVNAVFADDELDEESEKWLARLLRHSSSSLRMAKRAFRLASAGDFEARLEEVERLYLEELMRTDDATEGLVAFIEKRLPVWKGK